MNKETLDKTENHNLVLSSMQQPGRLRFLQDLVSMLSIRFVLLASAFSLPVAICVFEA